MLLMFNNFAQTMSSQANQSQPDTQQPNLMGMMNQLSGNFIRRKAIDFT
jgi:hypothetical protein